MDLVFELVAVYGCSAAAGAGWVTGLKHEVGDYAVEKKIVVVAAAGEGFEVFTGLRGVRSCSGEGEG